MERFSKKTFLRMVAASTAIICMIVLFFFKTTLFTGIAGRCAGIFSPFIVGAVIAYLLRPACLFIEKWLTRWLDKNRTGKQAGMIRMFSILLSLVLLFLLLLMLLMAVIPELVNSISGLLGQLPDTMERFGDWLASLDKGELSHEFVTSVESALDTLTERLTNFLRTDLLPHLQSMVTSVTSSFMGILNVVKNFGLGCIISAYILGSWEKFVYQFKMILYAAFPKKTADWIKKEVQFTDEMFSGFIHGKILDSMIIGLLCFIVVTILRMPYAMLVSIIVGVTNVIPFFGPYLGAIPSAILILTVSPSKCLIFVIFIIVLQQIDGNVIGPKILGDRLGLSSFWILFSILVFGSFWGVIGMLIGAPVFAVAYDLIRTWVRSWLEKRGETAIIKEYEKEFYGQEPEKKA